MKSLPGCGYEGGLGLGCRPLKGYKNYGLLCKLLEGEKKCGRPCKPLNGNKIVGAYVGH